jgi:hypothetical protein
MTSTGWACNAAAVWGLLCGGGGGGGGHVDPATTHGIAAPAREQKAPAPAKPAVALAGCGCNDPSVLLKGCSVNGGKRQ